MMKQSRKATAGRGPDGNARRALLCCAALLSLGLAACNNTGSLKVARERAEDQKDIISLTSSSSPDETASEISARSAAIFSRIDSLTASTFYGETDNPGLPTFNIAADCRGAYCTLTEPRSGLSETISLADLANFESTGTGRVVLTKNGFTLINVSGGDGGPNYRAYGAWGDHGGFSVETKAQFSDRTITLRGASAGQSLTGSRPTRGSLTWRGVMVGTPARGAQRDNILQGDAEIIYDLESQTINARFDKIKDLDRKADHTVPTVRFDNIPVRTDGTFSSGHVGNKISGGFAGPNHAEAGGTFEQMQIVGAFGAKRQ
ncbi:hypothetical protein [Hoeflea sp.]|uniref:hypothetical protein n=1 Tax=Hoeflea sp. TaxID=1940281 RepID=UPI003B013E08